MEKHKKNVQQINIQLDEKISSGEYANFVVVTHSPAEFVLDFTRILPGVPKAKVHSRIIMAPQHAKAFVGAINENIKKFEDKHGEIKMPNKGEGFMWTNDKIINQLMEEINKTYDLDNNVVFVMRNLKLISSEVLESQSQCE